MKLRNEDARVVDLLLDRAAAAQGNGNGNGGLFAATPATSHAGVSNEQIAAAEKVLHLLDALPAGDPAQDLVRRTLERIDGHAHAPLRALSPALVDASRPVA